jgi:hypothetical protein
VKAKERVDQFVREGLGKDDIKKRINSFVSLSSQPALRQLLIGELDTYAPTKSTPPKAMYDVRTAAKRAGVNYDLLSKGKRFKSVYKDALDTYADGIKHKWNLRDIDDGLRSGFVDKYGNDFPELRKMIRAMYGGR